MWYKMDILCPCHRKNKKYDLQNGQNVQNETTYYRKQK